jgi:hypothetical protein
MSNQLQIDFVPTGDQIADGFTKALAVRQLQNFIYNLNLARCDWGGVLNELYMCNVTRMDEALAWSLL